MYQIGGPRRAPMNRLTVAILFVSTVLFGSFAFAQTAAPHPNLETADWSTKQARSLNAEPIHRAARHELSSCPMISATMQSSEAIGARIDHCARGADFEKRRSDLKTPRLTDMII
jgi:hypothetical protein